MYLHVFHPPVKEKERADIECVCERVEPKTYKYYIRNREVA